MQGALLFRLLPVAWRIPLDTETLWLILVVCIGWKHGLRQPHLYQSLQLSFLTSFCNVLPELAVSRTGCLSGRPSCGQCLSCPNNFLHLSVMACHIGISPFYFLSPVSFGYSEKLDPSCDWEGSHLETFILGDFHTVQGEDLTSFIHSSFYLSQVPHTSHPFVPLIWIYNYSSSVSISWLQNSNTVNVIIF